uniref:ATP synthase F1 complex delta/epsilon subunit N-terminal domain-containing protein n=1 Tax=uncultured Alphaproteobacteria bacterium TaxID=91750 RepID=A0A6G8F320_9PROT|nr:hypothetical protein PlAlph_5920 [uncultured Alphaproteobacteria bacterium]
MAEVSYKLVQPEKTVDAGKAWGVVLPCAENNLTVITGRAPSLVLLEDGLLRVIDESGKTLSSFLIRKGMATIADDHCLVASETIIPADGISLDEALEKAKTDSFYQTVVDYLVSVKK